MYTYTLYLVIDSNRGRVKSSNSRRGDHPSGTPPHYDPRDRYKVFKQV